MLAAGVGRRLGNAGQGKPKCLLECGGQSLLTRHLETLADLEIRQLNIITGYRAEAVAAAVRDAPLPVRLVHNACFRRGSLLSLWCARNVRPDEHEPILLMDADVLYDPQLLARLVRHPGGNCLLLDRDFADEEEPVRVVVRGERITAFGKNPRPDPGPGLQGESVGFFRLAPETWEALQARSGERVRRGDDDAEYEQVLQDVILAPPGGERFQYLDITGLAWTEIDFPEDLQRACTSILARIG